MPSLPSWMPSVSQVDAARFAGLDAVTQSWFGPGLALANLPAKSAVGSVIAVKVDVVSTK